MFIPVPPNTSFTKITENAVATAIIHIGVSIGHIIGISKPDTKVIVNFEPSAATLTDDAKSGDICGNIISFHYIGDHYSYTVRSESEEDYVVDDADLWNQGDYVGVVIPEDSLNITVL